MEIDFLHQIGLRVLTQSGTVAIGCTRRFVDANGETILRRTADDTFCMKIKEKTWHALTYFAIPNNHSLKKKRTSGKTPFTVSRPLFHNFVVSLTSNYAATRVFAFLSLKNPS